MTIDLAANKEEFERLVKKYVKREGVEKVLNWLENSSDFYTAPASTQYHLCVEGGLCQHSLNVFKAMVDLCNTYYGIDPSTYEDDSVIVYNGDSLDDDGAFGMENIAIVALFHDICKANCYVKDFKNVKVNGQWQQQEYWRWEEQFVYGHGAKSVYILQQYMRLFIEEAQAIRYHMGGKDDPLSDSYDRTFSQVFDNSALAVLVHLADMEATYLVEKV